VNPLAPATRLPRAAPARVLACGAYLKNRACLVDGDRVSWSAAHGDLGGAGGREALAQSLEQMLARAAGPVQAVACDLHPDFYSTRLAHAIAQRLGVPVIGVQHHHAHTGVVLAELGMVQAVIGVALDGMGLGTDGAAWGGEVLWVPGADATQAWCRLDHLATLAQPGGDAAAHEPWRLAAAVLFALGRGDEIVARFAPAVGDSAARVLHGMLQCALNCPPSSSAGRWFDAAAGALGLRLRQGSEAEAAIALEALATGWLARHGEAVFDWPSLDLAPLVGELFALRTGGGDALARGAAQFHLALASALVRCVAGHAARLDCRRVVLSGGCLANRVLRAALRAGLQRHDLQVLEPQGAGCGDAGLALGQAWLAAHTVAQQRVPQHADRPLALEF
jgi:hydrogenase maturation protein HypF